MKLLDEVHHLTTNNIESLRIRKRYVQVLNIPSVKQLALTATLKYLENTYNDDMVISNNNIHFFEKVIDKRNLS